MHQTRRFVVGAVIAACALALAACSSSGSGGSSGGGSGAVALPSSTAAPTTAGLEAAAKAEGGTLNVYIAPEWQNFLTKPFEKLYPWAKINVTPLEPGPAQAKFLSEYNAGVYNADIVSVKFSQLEPLVEAKSLTKVALPNQKLIDPQLTDPWDITHTVDNDAIFLVYNTKLVKTPPKTLLDMTQSQWKGKIETDDPLTGTSSGLLFASLRQKMGDSKWQTWLKGLKANDTSLVADGDTALEDVLRGEKSMCFCELGDYAAEPAGVPLALDLAPQDAYGGITSAAGGMGISAKAKHPAMAAFWLNWVMSTNGGQEQFAKSGRIPASIEKVNGLLPKAVLPAGTKYLPQSTLTDYYKNPTPYNNIYKQDLGA